MFFISWIISMIVAVIVCAGIFGLVESFYKGQSYALIAGLSAFATSIVYLVAFFPRPRKKRH
ncbi:MAG: hypothetical protein B1H03_05040 [Planctomycetales bacterium 4484_113]|nr:MAG: hypothetical protein B1H03_05040 [Planctomycetales bacterium 4484_113]